MKKLLWAGLSLVAVLALSGTGSARVQGAAAPGSAPAGGGGYEQVFQINVELNRALSEEKCKVGDMVSVSPATKVRLRNGLEVTPSTRFIGSVVKVERLAGASGSSVTVNFERMQLAKGVERVLHATVLLIAPPRDFLHPNYALEPREFATLGIIPKVAEDPEQPAEKKGMERIQRDGIPGVDLHSNLLGLASGTFQGVRREVYLPAGTRMILMVEVRPADFEAP